MAVQTRTLSLQTRGRGHILDITSDVARAVRESKMRDGVATLFVPGSTASVTTMEFEPGLVKDMADLFERLAPSGEEYAHHETGGDDNGASHLRASLLGPSLAVPFAGGRLVLGTWQQVVFIDHDTRPRSREVVVQVMGE
jgi:secondary thiamine-phosphate synthase enzyme